MKRTQQYIAPAIVVAVLALAPLHYSHGPTAITPERYGRSAWVVGGIGLEVPGSRSTVMQTVIRNNTHRREVTEIPEFYIRPLVWRPSRTDWPAAREYELRGLGLVTMEQTYVGRHISVREVECLAQEGTAKTLRRLPCIRLRSFNKGGNS